MTSKDSEGKTLKDIREDAGRTAGWVANTLGIGRTTLYRWEKGDPVDVSEGRLLSVLLDTSLDAIADSQGYTKEWAREELARRIESRQEGNHQE